MEEYTLSDPLEFAGSINSEILSTPWQRYYNEILPQMINFRFFRTVGWKILKASQLLSMVKHEDIDTVEMLMREMARPQDPDKPGDGQRSLLLETKKKIWLYIKEYAPKLIALRFSDPTFVTLSKPGIEIGELKEDMKEILQEAGAVSFCDEVYAGRSYSVWCVCTKEEFISKLPKHLQQLEWDYQQVDMAARCIRD